MSSMWKGGKKDDQNGDGLFAETSHSTPQGDGTTTTTRTTYKTSGHESRSHGSMWKNGQQQNGDGLIVEPPHPIPQDDGGSRNSRSSYTRRAHEEPTERTRLLDHPRPPNSDGYLDPDDPAVRSIRMRNIFQN
jgi:hypothetical protein